MIPAEPAVTGDPLAGLGMPPWHPGPLQAAARAQQAAAEELNTIAARETSAVSGTVGSAWLGQAAASCLEVGTRLAAAHTAAARYAHTAAQAMATCASAWERAGEKYRHARRLADEALREEHTHRDTARSAARAAAASGDAVAAQIAALAASGHDGYASPLRSRAISLAQQAVDEFHHAARTAAAALDAHARALNPPQPRPAPAHHDHPSGSQGVLGWLKDRANDAAGAAADAGQPLLNFGEHLTTHPLDTLKLVGDGLGMLAGTAGIVVGGGGEVLGVGLDATGAGTVVGLPLNVASAGLIAAGGTLAITSANQLSSDLNRMSAESQSEGSSGGAEDEAADAASIDTDLSELDAGRSPGVRVVDSEEELDAIFDRWSRGGEEIEKPSYAGKYVRLSDGTEVGMRSTSKSGGPTIDVRRPDGTTARVHVR